MLEILKELLDTCIIDKASDFQSTKKLLDKNTYDAAILDIVGVQGFDLLEITRKMRLPTLILTAHAISPERFFKSIEKEALAFIPKEKISEIRTYLKDMP